MTEETSTRIGLPVVLAFAIVFGLILTRHSGQYEVAPPSPAEGRADEGQATSPPIDRAGLGDRTFAHRQSPRRSTGWPRSEGREPDPSPPVDTLLEPLPPPSVGTPEPRSRQPVDPAPVLPPASAMDDAAGSETEPEERRIEIAPPAEEPATERAPSVQRQRETPRREPPPERTEPKPERGRLILPGQEPAPGDRVAKVEEQARPKAASPEPEPEPRRPAVYVVQRNDNLSKICKAVYGTMDYRVVQAVYEANRDKLKSKNRVLPGQKLRIPSWPPTRVKRTSGGSSVPTGSKRESGDRSTIRIPPPASSGGSKKGAAQRSRQEPTKSSPSRSRRYKWYRVGKNESLSRIAQKRLGNGRRWREIWKMNKDRIRQPNKVQAGKLIKVPLAVPVSG